MRVILFANTDWYLFNFRLTLARALCDAGHDVLLISPPGPYGDELRRMGFSWRAVPMHRRSLNPMREFALLLWLYRLFRRERPDLVHGFTIKCAVYGSIAARLLGSCARINAVAGMGYVFTSQQIKARLLRPFIRFLLRVALGGEGARLVLQNPEDVEFFRTARLVRPERIRLIPGSGVDCTRYSPSLPTQSAAPSRFRVLLAARVLWDKGIAEYVAAARLLHDAGRPIDLLLAGEPDEGNPAAVPYEQLKKWQEEGCIQWLGQVSDMPTLLRSVHVAVLPSYREGLPRSLVEAAACGLALVTTDTPGCREVVEAGVDGLLVPARDAAALAGAIARLQDDPSLREEFGARARLKVLARFDERIVIRNTLAVYDELVSSGRAD